MKLQIRMSTTCPRLITCVNLSLAIALAETWLISAKNQHRPLQVDATIIVPFKFILLKGLTYYILLDIISYTTYSLNI